MRRFVALPGAGALAREAAARFIARAQEAVAARGHFVAPRVDWARA